MLLSRRQHAVGQRVRINDDVQTYWNTEYNVAVKEYRVTIKEIDTFNVVLKRKY